MTKREFIILVATKLQEQGSYCLDLVAGICRYRENRNATDVKRCGIGHTIPDELYHERLEERTARQILDFPDIQNYFFELLPDLTEDNEICDFLNGVQRRLHDSRVRDNGTTLPLLTPEEALEVCKDLL